MRWHNWRIAQWLWLVFFTALDLRCGPYIIEVMMCATEIATMMMSVK